MLGPFFEETGANATSSYNNNNNNNNAEHADARSNPSAAHDSLRINRSLLATGYPTASQHAPNGRVTNMLYVHRLCALWSPEVYVSNETGKYRNVLAAVRCD